MATISAASLAFAGVEVSHWAARALFSGALGSSLCAVFTLHILGVYAEGVPDNVIGAGLQSEVNESSVTLYLLACTLAAPAVIGAWATFLVLAGLIAFIYTTESKVMGFQLVAFVPIGLSLVTVVMTLGVAEFMWRKSFRVAKKPNAWISR